MGITRTNISAFVLLLVLLLLLLLLVLLLLLLLLLLMMMMMMMIIAKPVYDPGISKRPPRPVLLDSSKSLSHLRLWRAVASEVFAGQVVVLDKGSVQAYAANTLPIVVLLER